MLDRKLRIISENIDSESEWVSWAQIAYKAIYGFDYQGDNVLIARENLLFTFIEAYIDKFDVPPINEYLMDIAEILSWNIWQMDGLKYVIPNSCKPYKSLQLSFFDEDKEYPCEGCEKNDPHKHTGIYCKVMDWDTKKPIKFISLIGGKF